MIDYLHFVELACMYIITYGKSKSMKEATNEINLPNNTPVSIYIYIYIKTYLYMFTLKTWHLHVPSPISKHPNASIRETTSRNFRKMK